VTPEPPDTYLRAGPFQRPLAGRDSPEEVALRALRVRDHLGKTPCACATALCRGAASADWASCAPGCKPCAPIPWQPPVRHNADGDLVNARGGDDAAAH
jgi:hypothetical protein